MTYEEIQKEILDYINTLDGYKLNVYTGEHNTILYDFYNGDFSGQIVVWVKPTLFCIHCGDRKERKTIFAVEDVGYSNSGAKYLNELFLFLREAQQ